ncbi:MAG: hypothetical protein ACXWC9_08370 [Pseudobdellovibrionaceae bacterium]
MKTMKTLFLGIGIALMALTANADHQLEPLLGHFSTQGGIHIQVYSGGCTWKKQFEVTRENLSGRIRLSFIRKTSDPCRAYIPYGEMLTFSFEELGLKANDVFEIANPVSATRVSRMQ